MTASVRQGTGHRGRGTGVCRRENTTCAPFPVPCDLSNYNTPVEAVMETALIAQFRAIVGERHCISEPDQLLTYECDALTSFRVRPGLVVLPRSTEEVVQVVRLARAAGLPIVPRGSGTGLSGGALPVPGCGLL